MEYDLDAKLFTMAGKTVRAFVKSIYDGDTMTCIFGVDEIENGKQFMWKCRLLGIDTPEIRGSGPIEKKWAREARDFLIGLVEKKEIELDIQGQDKYGRLLVDPFILGEAGERTGIVKMLIDKGLGVPYEGVGAKYPWETGVVPKNEN